MPLEARRRERHNKTQRIKMVVLGGFEEVKSQPGKGLLTVN